MQDCNNFCRVTACGHRTRTEQFERPMSYTDAFEKVSNFYTDKRKFGAASENFKNGKAHLALLCHFTKSIISWYFRQDLRLHSRLSKPSRHRARPHDWLPLRLWDGWCVFCWNRIFFRQVRDEGAHAFGREHACEFGGLQERDGL